MSSSGRLMRAMRVSEFGAPAVLQLCADVRVPQPGRRQVLIRVHACGVNPVETYIRSGTYSRKPALPFVLGTDVAGVVESVGEGVTGVKAGERVFTTATESGGYADFTLSAEDCVHKLPHALDFSQGAAIGIPYFTAYRALAGERVFTTATESGGYAEFTLSAEDCVHKLPLALDFSQGAAIGIPYFTAYRALVHKAHVKAGETVLIHGASGGVGVAACQLARALGLRVLGTAGTPDGMKLALQNGAHLAFNHREEGYTDKIMDATEGRGVDVIVEMLSNVNLSKDLQMAATGGRVLVVGSRGPIEINPRDAMMRESSVTGVYLFLATPWKSLNPPSVPQWLKDSVLFFKLQKIQYSMRGRRGRSVQLSSTQGWKLVGCVQWLVPSIHWTRRPRLTTTSWSLPEPLGRLF